MSAKKTATKRATKKVATITMGFYKGKKATILSEDETHYTMEIKLEVRLPKSVVK